MYAGFWAPYIVREHFPAIALAERGSLNVDRYMGWSPDIFPGPRGGAYINNNPGASLTAAIPLVLLRPVLARIDAWNQTLARPSRTGNDGDLFWRTVSEGRALYFLVVGFVTVALVMAPATAGTAAYLCTRLAEAGVPAAQAAGAAVLYGLGTPVLFRAGHLNHNLLVGDAGFTALLMLWNPNNSPIRPSRAALAGLLAGYAVLCDFSGLVVVLVAALYVFLRSTRQSASERWRLMAAFGAGVIPGVLALAIYQTWAFGSFYRPSQHYMPATAPTSHGYRGFDWPSPALVWANFFDPRFGLFAYCPALILALAAPFVKRVRFRIPQREAVVLFTYFAGFVDLLRGESVFVAPTHDGVSIPSAGSARAGVARIANGADTASGNRLGGCNCILPAEFGHRRRASERSKVGLGNALAERICSALDDPPGKCRHIRKLGIALDYIHAAGTRADIHLAEAWSTKRLQHTTSDRGFVPPYR